MENIFNAVIMVESKTGKKVKLVSGHFLIGNYNSLRDM